MTAILVVDDAASMRKMLSSVLTEAGYTVAEAADGQAALAEAGRVRFDLVISDVNMPVMDGITLVRELRALPEYRFTPIIMLTTESSKLTVSQGKTAGATGWIIKPFNPQQLLATILKVLN